MKNFKWKTFLITSIICLLPIFLGVALWDELPEEIAIHFNINNEPDNFASKGFAVFGLPVIMVLFQLIACLSVDLKPSKYASSRKFETIGKWIIPFMSVVLYVATLSFALDYDVDIRKVACSLVGIIFVVMGNYLPKLDYVKSYNLPKEVARRVNRFMGFGLVILGILMLTSLFFQPIVSVLCLVLILIFSVISIIYTLWIVRHKK